MKNYYKDVNFKAWNYFYYTHKTISEQNCCCNTEWISLFTNLKDETSYLLTFNHDKIGFQNIFLAVIMKKELL